MFWTRLISGAVLLALTILVIVISGPLLAVVLCVISVIGLFELYRVFGSQKSLPAVFTYIFTVVFYAGLYFGYMDFFLMAFLIYFMLLLCVYVFSYPKHRVDEITKTVFGFFYVAMMLSFILRARELPISGAYIVWLIFLTSWGCDTCAYCVGMLFGKHKMSPKLSPKKSVEGAIGGIAGSVILSFIFCYIFKDAMALPLSRVFIIAALSGIGAFISMVGDLAASAIKRNYDIKDYGRLIPGHGGILDRFDSVIITAPIIFYLGLYTL